MPIGQCLFAGGEWKVPHSLALFEESDVLCVADREGWKVDCINAGLQKPRHANRDDTGKLVHSYTDVGRPYAIGSKGKQTFRQDQDPCLHFRFQELPSSS